MTFRVETSPEAELDAISILEWLLARAGDTGLRWFMAMDEAIASLADCPERCTLAPETARFPFEVRQLLYGKSPTHTASFSLSGVTPYMCFTFATVGADTLVSHTGNRSDPWFHSSHSPPTRNPDQPSFPG